MQRFAEIKCAVQRYDIIPVKHFAKYVDIARKQEESGKPTDPSLLDKIKHQFWKANCEFDRKDVCTVLDPVIEEMAHNEALTQLTLDYAGAKSKYFFPWLLEVWRSQSSALEMAFNAGFDCAGNWNKSIPKYDSFNYFIFNDPTFVYNRERELVMANIATEKQKVAMENGTVSKILDFGAGRMAWARYTGFNFCPEYQYIRAYDLDETICFDELFKKPLWQLGIEYEIADMRTGFGDPRNVCADLIFLAGVMTYLPKEQMFAIIKTMYSLLAPNGEFFFDLQIDCEYLQRSMCVFKWPKLRLPGSFTEAIADLENIRKKLAQEGMSFSAEYIPDTFNEAPSAVMVRLTKNI